MKPYCIFLLFLLCFWGCAADKSLPPLLRLSPSDYPVFTDDMHYGGLAESIGQSLRYLKRVPAERRFFFGGNSETDFPDADSYNAAHMIRSLETFLAFLEQRPSAKEMQTFIRTHYLVYKSSGSGEKNQVLFTGYYEPLLRGSLQKSAEYPWPVYGPPHDLLTADLSLFSSEYKGKTLIGRVEGKRFLPYYERKEIDNGALAGKAPELLWVDDAVDLFFLQIQGSGKIALENGETVNVHYHSKNGRPYRSIGKILIEEKKIARELMSMQKIREYLRTHPEEQERILHANPSYVFFSVEKEGPLGALNVRLTPGRSLAADRKIFPMSALAFVQTQRPLTGDASGKALAWIDFSRFLLNQDTGGAIKGPGRADIFWGHGDYAVTAAGHLKHPGSLYFLVLRPEK